MSENQRLNNDYFKPGYPMGELSDQGRIGCIPGGGVDISQFTVQRQRSEQEQIADAFALLAKLVAALPDTDEVNGARRNLADVGAYIARHFIARAVYPEGKPSR